MKQLQRQASKAGSIQKTKQHSQQSLREINNKA
jgi:hypothetical protein